VETRPSLLQEGVIEFLSGGVKGALAFMVLGTVGSIRRGQIPLPLAAQLIFGLNRAVTNQSASPLASPYAWLKLPLMFGFGGFWGGGYIGYSQWKLEKEQQRYWAEQDSMAKDKTQQ